MLHLPPFRLRVDSEALKIDFEALSLEVQTHLTANVAYNPATHDVYQFTVVPEFTFDWEADGRSNVSRKLKKQSWSIVDRLAVQVRLLTDAVKLLGAFPKTTHSDETGWHIDEIEATFGAKLFKVLTLGLVGRAKNYARCKVPAIIAWQSSTEAQWSFERSYIASDPDFQMKILCAVPRGATVTHHIAVCDVAAMENGRTVAKSLKNMIGLPA